MIPKFRAWKDGKMYYSNEQQTVWVGGLCASVNGVERQMFTVDYEYVMQFTGLLDCQGKEIWEGDRICIMGNRELSGQVIWDHSGFVILWDRNNVRRKTIETDREPIFHNCSVSLEVTGNIFEEVK